MEASETFSGAFAMMKASAKNLLGNLSVGDGKAVAKNMGELVESASTFSLVTLYRCSRRF